MTAKIINDTNLLNLLKLKPNIDDMDLTKNVVGLNELNEKIEVDVVTEKPFTIFLNSQEIVTTMSLGDMPKELAVGYLLNQNMLNKKDVIEEIDYDDELDVVVIRTKRKTNYEKKLTKKIRTSGCAVGTVYGDMMETFYDVKLNDDNFIKTSWMINISKKITEIPSLYIKAGAIHGCALCYKENILAYVEDVGRHNAVDKIAGYMFLKKISASNKIFYTTGRLTSEMVIKTIKMGIPILISRSGFTAWGVELAKGSNLTLIGRAKGKKYLVLSGEERIEYK